MIKFILSRNSIFSVIFPQKLDKSELRFYMFYMNKLIEFMKLVSRARGYCYFINEIREYQKRIPQFYLAKMMELRVGLNLNFTMCRKKEKTIRSILNECSKEIELIEHKKYMSKVEAEMQWLTWHLG